MSHRFVRRPLVLASGALVVAAIAAIGLAAPGAADRGKPSVSAATASANPPTRKAVFFAADGLRQDLVAKSASRGPARRRWGSCSSTASARWRRAADAGAAEHRRRLVQPRDRRVAGRRTARRTTPSTSTARRSRNRTRPSIPACCRPSRSPSRPSAAASRSPRSSGPAGATRPSTARRSTSARSSRAAASRPTTSAKRRPLFDDAPFVTELRPAVRPSRGFAGQAPFPGAAPTPATGWTNVPASYSPAQEMRLRVLDFGVDKYGLNAYIYDSTQRRHAPTTTASCSRSTKDGADAVGDLREGEWADVKVGIVGRRARTARPAGMLVKVETLAPDLSQVRLFHTSVTRAIATWPTWPGEPGFTATSRSSSRSGSRPRRPPISPSSRRASSARRRTSSRASTGRPATTRCSVHRRDATSPTCCWSAIPVTDEFQHQFLGLVTPDAAQRRSPTRPTTTSRSTASPDGRVGAARGLHPRAPTRAPTRRWRSPAADGPRIRRPSSRPTTASRRSSWRSTPARCSSTSGCCRRPQTSQLPPGHRRDDRQGQGLLGRRHGADLPQPRRPRSGCGGGPSRRSRRPTRRQRSPQIEDAFSA